MSTYNESCHPKPSKHARARARKRLAPGRFVGILESKGVDAVIDEMERIGMDEHEKLSLVLRLVMLVIDREKEVGTFADDPYRYEVDE